MTTFARLGQTETQMPQALQRAAFVKSLAFSSARCGVGVFRAGVHRAWIRLSSKARWPIALAAFAASSAEAMAKSFS